MHDKINEVVSKVLLLGWIAGLEGKILDTKARTTDHFGNPLDKRGAKDRDNEVKLLSKKLLWYKADLRKLKP